jgi:hypothetical protein
MRHRKKPVEIDAVEASRLIHYATKQWEKLPSWIVSEYDAGNIVFAPTGISIKTLEGTMHADPKDWIIRGVKGELYPCKPDIFAATYDTVDFRSRRAKPFPA